MYRLSFVAFFLLCGCPFVGAGADDDRWDQDGDNVESTIDCDDDNALVQELTWYADADGDGFGNVSLAVSVCEAPSGFVADSTDCNDLDASVSPDAEESCNGLDDNCDDATDEDPEATGPLASVWYWDADGDGYGDLADEGIEACESLDEMRVLVSGDCDDTSDSINPGMDDICNGVDDNCDGDEDEDGTAIGPNAQTWYADFDGDTFGDAEDEGTVACAAPTPWSIADNTDCNDADATVHPGAEELCNSMNDDCDGETDEDPDAIGSAAKTWYADEDGDSYGDLEDNGTVACDAPSESSVLDHTDCDDSNGAISPEDTETCNSEDDDCDGVVDEPEGVDSTWWLDQDGDGFGGEAFFVVSCSAPSDAFTNDEGDCDDDDALTYPDAAEDCEDVDRNCDGEVDGDADGDGYSDADCGGLDCDDADDDIYPMSEFGGCYDSCATILEWDPTASDGTYEIDPDGPNAGEAPFEVTCDMTNDGWTLIFHEDYESYPDPDWSLSSVTTCGGTTTFPPTSKILGGFGTISDGEITNTLDTLGIEHTEARVQLIYYAIDDWEGYQAYVKIDGTKEWTTTWNHGGSAYNLCGQYSSNYYDTTFSVDRTASHIAPSLTLAVGAGPFTDNDGVNYNSFGFDNLYVWVR